MTTLPPLAPSDSASAAAQQLRYMQIFENKGAAMGCSNPHPHGQLWTTTSLPDEIAIELENMKKYRKEHGGKHMLEDYAALESGQKERNVFENSVFLALVPWWATWPFEVMILSKKHRRALVDFGKEEQTALAEVLAEVTRRYDNLFETQFPYSELRRPEIRVLANMLQAWGCTKRRWKARRKRSKRVISTSTFIRRSYAARPSENSLSGTNCWRSRNGI